MAFVLILSSLARLNLDRPVHVNREKRLNVRMEQLTKLVQTLTEKVADLEFRSKSENEAIARKSPSKSKQMKLGASKKGGKNTQSYDTVCGCTRSEYEVALDDPVRLPFEENQRTERTRCKCSNRSTCVADRRSLQHALQLQPFTLLYRTYAIIYTCATNAHSLFCCPSCLEAVHIHLHHVSTFRTVKII